MMSEINGLVKFGGISKGKRKLIITGDDGAEREYDIPRGTHINVQEDDRVRAGEALMDGPLNPHDILRVLGPEALQQYIVNEIQEVYRLQGVNINDKHIECIVRQMLRWVKIKDVGDTEFLLEEQVDRFRYEDENRRVQEEGGKPSSAEPLLLGITKASLSTDSFISAASFQETPAFYRSRNFRSCRLSARLKGKRHYGTTDSGGNRNEVLPQRQGRIRPDCQSEEGRGIRRFSAYQRRSGFACSDGCTGS
jgi:hypothetical protein